jgi:hypothetical protein
MGVEGKEMEVGEGKKKKKKRKNTLLYIIYVFWREKIFCHARSI